MNQDDCIELARENGAMEPMRPDEKIVVFSGSVVFPSAFAFAAFCQALADKVREEDAALRQQQGGAVAGGKSCPFCNGPVDEDGWLDGSGNRGPECMSCGATAPSMEVWNTRPAPSAVPDGWQLVPKEPTDEMMRAHDECLMRGVPRGRNIIYDAMLAAAPEPEPK